MGRSRCISSLPCRDSRPLQRSCRPVQIRYASGSEVSRSAHIFSDLRLALRLRFLGSRYPRPGDYRRQDRQRFFWRRPGSNRQPPACKTGALPIELRPPGEGGLFLDRRVFRSCTPGPRPARQLPKLSSSELRTSDSSRATFGGKRAAPPPHVRYPAGPIPATLAVPPNCGPCAAKYFEVEAVRPSPPTPASIRRNRPMLSRNILLDPRPANLACFPVSA